MLLLIVLLGMSALISGSEVAFFSLSPQQLHELESSKTASAKSVLDLYNNPKELLATILISNNFVNVAIILISSLVAQKILSISDIEILGFVISEQAQIFFINVVLITFVILMLGEVIPKVYASKHPLQLASITGRLLKITHSVLKKVRLVDVLVKSTAIVEKSIKRKKEKLTADDLENALDLTSGEDTEEDDHKILKGIVKFGNTDVKQIMTPRVNVVAIDISLTFEEVIQTIVDSGFSRIPVYHEVIDQIKGILYAKDILPELDNKDFDWTGVLREAYFVPENKMIDDLLKEFQEMRIHLAIVVDEYGGVSGIVTLEDIIEEIVGDISDEFDDEDLYYSKLDDNTFIFEGQTALNDFYRVFGIDGKEFEEAKGESDSLGGFILELAGKIPRKNEKIKFNNYTFVIEAADKRRIKQVKVIRTPDDEN